MKRSANAEMQIGVELAVTEEAVGTYLLGALLAGALLVPCLGANFKAGDTQLICSVLQIPTQYDALQSNVLLTLDASARPRRRVRFANPLAFGSQG